MSRQSHNAIERIKKIASMSEADAKAYLRSEKRVEPEEASAGSLERFVGHRVSWFSAGVSSAVATKLAIDEIDQIFYIHIDDQHPDTLRFVKECEAWFGKPITIMQSDKRNVSSAVLSAGGRGWINGVGGAACTRALKKRVRQEWEQANVELYPMRYYWGMDSDEKSRADRILQTMPEFQHAFPLIERGINVEEAHQILRASGIKRPAMYDLGYHNNNCIGCVKGGMGYWNKIRVDFPDVFASRAKLEREVGASCIKGVYLDELDPERGRHDPPIADDCGIMCELQALKPSEQPNASATMPNEKLSHTAPTTT